MAKMIVETCACGVEVFGIEGVEGRFEKTKQRVLIPLNDEKGMWTLQEMHIQHECMPEFDPEQFAAELAEMVRTNGGRHGG